jgi:hypothetical protein
MTKQQQNYQPGVIFNDVFLGGLRAIGSNTREFSKKHGLQFQNLRTYATGHTNGPRAHEVRELMIREIGPDLFDALYRARAKKEGLM